MDNLALKKCCDLLKVAKFGDMHNTIEAETMAKTLSEFLNCKGEATQIDTGDGPAVYYLSDSGIPYFGTIARTKDPMKYAFTEKSVNGKQANPYTFLIPKSQTYEDLPAFEKAIIEHWGKKASSVNDGKKYATNWVVRHKMEAFV